MEASGENKSTTDKDFLCWALNHHHSYPRSIYDGNLIEVPRGMKRKFSKEIEERDRLRRYLDKIYALREEHNLEWEEGTVSEDDELSIDEEACEGDPHRSRQLEDELTRIDRLKPARLRLLEKEDLLNSIKSWLEDDGFVDTDKCPVN